MLDVAGFFVSLYLEQTVFKLVPRVEYKLTELGRSFLPAMNGIIDWALENSKALTPDA